MNSIKTFAENYAEQHKMASSEYHKGFDCYYSLTIRGVFIGNFGRLYDLAKVVREIVRNDDFIPFDLKDYDIAVYYHRVSTINMGINVWKDCLN